MHRVVSFAIVGPHELEVGFEDGVVRRINFLPVLEGELFGPLKDLDVFNQVALSPEGYTLLWPNGADFDPATLHDWPEIEAEFVEMAQSWGRRVNTATDLSRHSAKRDGGLDTGYRLGRHLPWPHFPTESPSIHTNAGAGPACGDCASASPTSWIYLPPACRLRKSLRSCLTWRSRTSRRAYGSPAAASIAAA